MFNNASMFHCVDPVVSVYEKSKRKENDQVVQIVTDLNDLFKLH